MKTVREYIIEANEKGYDVEIDKDGSRWERNGKGWSEYYEGWYEENANAFDNCKVLVTETYDEEKILVLVLAE